MVGLVQSLWTASRKTDWEFASRSWDRILLWIPSIWSLEFSCLSPYEVGKTLLAQFRIGMFYTGAIRRTFDSCPNKSDLKLNQLRLTFGGLPMSAGEPKVLTATWTSLPTILLFPKVTETGVRKDAGGHKLIVLDHGFTKSILLYFKKNRPATGYFHSYHSPSYGLHTFLWVDRFSASGYLQPGTSATQYSLTRTGLTPECWCTGNALGGLSQMTLSLLLSVPCSCAYWRTKPFVLNTYNMGLAVENGLRKARCEVWCLLGRKSHEIQWGLLKNN